MPIAIETEQIERAEAAISQAQRTRKYHARRTEKKSLQRKADLDIALGALKDSMRPVRSALARLATKTQSASIIDERERLRDLSARIQRERRKLWKMRKNW